LGQLRRSEEGGDYAAKLPRLDAAIRCYRWAQNLIIGWLVRLFTPVERNHATERKLRGLQSQLFLLGEDSNRCFNQMENTITGLHRLITDQIEQIKTVVPGVSGTAQANEIFAPPLPLSPTEAEGLKQLSPHARDIYVQLKTAAAIQAGRFV
jgi:hypothetical protein